MRLHAPMPESSPAHPAGCDWISYLRFRHARGPRRASRADAVVVLMPGIFAGGGSFDQVARNTVRRAAKRGRQVEVWGIDRRSNCLEDHRGVRAGARTGDPRVSFGYYFEGREVDGKQFPGFADERGRRVPRDVGLERTIEDWHTIITREIPSQRTRQRKLICGGHSLGGPLTAALASWDFDGDPETTRTRATTSARRSSGSTRPCRSRAAATGGGAGAGILTGRRAERRLSVRERAAADAGDAAGAGADRGAPRSRSRIEETIVTQLIPRDARVGADAAAPLLAQRRRTSRPAARASRDFRVTNASALAAIFDDNSSRVSIFRASIGMYTGRPARRQELPGARSHARRSRGAARPAVPLADLRAGGRERAARSS